MNTQPIEKKILATSSTGTLQVHSIFYTIQGEGPFCGTPAVFVRLAGCNLQCPQCDTDYTSHRKNMYVYELLLEIKKHVREGLVVITGGEPFRQSIGRLITELINSGYYVQIETNGTIAPPDEIGNLWNALTTIRTGAYIVCAPKTGKIHPLILKHCCALKYVISHDDVNIADGLPNFVLEHSASPIVARPPLEFTKPVYLQPTDAGDETINKYNLKTAIHSCMNYGYILQLQVHKIIDME